MKEKIVPFRVSEIRRKLGLSQAQFAIQISERLSETANITPVKISMWETGRRVVPEAVGNAICEIGGVSMEYLYGLTDMDGNEQKKLSNDEFIDSLDEIAFVDLWRYDKMPIYVEFLYYQHPNSWAIYSRKTNKLVFGEFSYPLTQKHTSEIRIYKMQPSYDFNSADSFSRRLDLNAVKKTDSVFIVMSTPDPEIRAMYNGWYSHNENHTALINERGLVLPYTGLGISYVAYYKVDE